MKFTLKTVFCTEVRENRREFFSVQSVVLPNKMAMHTEQVRESNKSEGQAKQPKYRALTLEWLPFFLATVLQIHFP